MRKILMIFFAALISSCSFSSNKNKKGEFPDNSFALNWQKDYGAIEIDSTFDSRFTITATKFLVRSQKPIIFRKVSIVDVIPNDQETDAIIVTYNHKHRFTFHFKLLIPKHLTNTVIEQAKSITSIVAEIDDVRLTQHYENIDYYTSYDEPYLNRYIVDNFYGSGTLVDYYGAEISGQSMPEELMEASTTPRTQSCEGMKSKFSSYAIAKEYVRNAPYKIKERINLDGSSWLKQAEYYSCDGKSGYFIILLKSGKDYIHDGVPSSVWEGFKKADSKGSFYDLNIKGKYRLELNK